jgi:hypothetical protein
MFNFSRETLWKSKMNFDAIFADFSAKRHTAKNTTLANVIADTTARG